ncbi:MAG: 23S rRNA (guanosine(2251)-2'-O)-methyltransferase RlmB [Saprospiraceae bacterium]|uniref:23S rRNA (Guanosine(2251)-2'-O)-methyltransferase RlmB n=1 Tax=Candidatus Opimibacter skivensis TaxID=2982028 RepID=A0A9D7XS47_9BACT|nr:23S rRNA (guanosine(2251)-2'-O)-methyltransferase RlmB [Candidatus Opimibacter skivensis]
MTKKGNWVIIGRHTVIEAIDSGQPIDKVLIDRQANLNEVVEKCQKLEIPVQKVPKEKLDKFGANHQGIAAFRSQVEYTSLEDLVPHLFDQGIIPLLMMLDRVTDVGNFGAISRSVEVLGADGLVFPAKETAQLNADAVKRSSGALLRIPLCRVRDLVSAVRFLKESGVTVIAADGRGTTPLHEVDFKQPMAIIMGSEGQGVAPELLRIVDHIVVIPQAGEMDSLNVSVAAGIMLYEAQRQRLPV